MVHFRQSHGLGCSFIDRLMLVPFVTCEPTMGNIS